MKKITAAITAAVMVISLAACSSEEVRLNSAAVSAEEPSAAENTASEKTDETAKSETTDAENAENASIASIAETAEAQAEASETIKQGSAVAKPNGTISAGISGGKGEPGEPITDQPEDDIPETVEPESEEQELIGPETVETETAEVVEPETSESDNEQPDTAEITDPSALLNNVWAHFGEGERFAVTGGDFSSGELIEEAAPFGLADPDALDYVAGFPAAEIGKIDSAATLMHMMNQNTFTAGAYHLVDPADMSALTEAVKANIMGRMWMCGFPDKFIAAQAGDYLVCAFGKNAQIDAFGAHLLEAYPSAKIVADEPIL